MKTKLCLFVFLASLMLFSQDPSNLVAFNHNASHSLEPFNTPNIRAFENSGFDFELLDAGVNTPFSEIGSGFFRNKLILVSSKKLGGLAKIDPNTKEAYKELYCLDISRNGALSTPYLFSRILNTNASEDQLTFSPDEKTVYYTRSSKENSLEFKLYRAVLEEGSHGKWINNKLLSMNADGVSIENPFMNRAGTQLYFSANLPDSYGGFDLYVCDIGADGSISAPKNLGNKINTAYDDKYPALSQDDKYFYFASKGHQNMGGFDLFTSKISKQGFKTPRNMGNTINSAYDEVAYFLATKNKGYVSSNRPNGKGSFDIYTAVNKEVIQTIAGRVIDQETQIKLPNTLIILKDEDGKELARTLTAENGRYSLNVSPFESYTLTTRKDGFKDSETDFVANRGFKTTYKKDFELLTTAPIITKVDNEMRIVLENIYFDFNKWNIKEESFISLNKILKVLKEHPEMKIAINAHTDNKGRDTYNLNLSNKRAASAANYLVKNGISKNRLEAKGFGESKPLTDCKNNCTEDELQANRRIEFVILHKPD